MRGETYIFLSTSHKTAEKGSQRLTVSLEERGHLEDYLQHIRPLLVGDNNNGLSLDSLISCLLPR